jgi:hypothetical protein
MHSNVVRERPGETEGMREIIRKLFHIAMRRIPASVAVRLHYLIHHGRVPNVRHPARFSEKIIHRKLFDRDPRLVIRSDKIAVREFVLSKLDRSFVIPIIWSGENLPAREERNWPVPFVMKSNNGSGTNIFVRSKDNIDWDVIEKKYRTWLLHSHSDWAGEWSYTQIKPKILVEPYVGDIAKLPIDYKFFVFAGRVEYIEVDTDQESESTRKRTFFDRNWVRQEFSLGYKTDYAHIARPHGLNDMIEAAEVLAEDIPYVSVDFYEIDGHPVFCEMTFYPDGGIAKFVPDSYDVKLGELWK